MTASPKLFADFVIWKRFHHLTLRIFKSVHSFRDGPFDESQTFDARSRTVMMFYVGLASERCTKWLPTFLGAMQLVRGRSKLLCDTCVLSAVDP